MMDLKRALCSKTFYLTMLGVCAFFLIGSVGYIVTNEGNDIVLYFHITYSIGALTKVLPIFMGVPYAGAFYEEIQSNSLHYILIRTNKRAYCWSKVIVCGLASGLSVVAGVGLFLLLLSTRIPWVLESGMNYEAFTKEIYGFLLQDQKYVLYFGVYLYTLFLATTFMSLVGLVCTVYFKSRLSSVVGPLIFYYLLFMVQNKFDLGRCAPYLVLERLMKGSNILGDPYVNLLYTTLFFITLNVVIGCWFTRLVSERIKKGEYV